ncbi:MAG: hypothetical protein AAF916_03375 [Planctomycetota bacterium]
MSKSGTLVLGAVAGSAAIVALAWTLGGPAELTTQDDLAAPQFATPDGLLAPSPDGGNPVRRVARAEFRSELEDGRVQVFSFAGVEPRSNVVFVSDFTEPRAELYLTGGRLVTIAAASGTFQHPGNVPTSGRFDSDVVVTLYEAENDALLDVDDAAQIVFRLYLDETTDFDRDLGRIVTEGPVHLTGPAASFRGRGLRLTYSADDERIAELIVEQGDELRLRRDAEDQVTTTDPTEAPPTAETPDDQASRGNATPRSQPRTEVPQPLEPLQYYRARFDENVLVRVGPDDEARLTGDTLDLAFAFVEGKEGPALTQTDRPRHDTRLASAETTEETTQTDAAPVLPPFPDASSVEEAWDGLAMGGWGGRELFTPRDDDVRITWAGPLTLYPLDGPPPMLRSGDNQAFPDPDAALLTLAGTPALVEVADPDRKGAPTTVAADALAYATATGHLEARGTPDRPFRMHAPDQGTLTGQHLDFRPDAPEFQADVAGPGRLAAAAKGPTGAADTNATAALNVQFAQRMRLAFLDDASTDASRDESQSPLDDLGRLAAADFAGQVHAIAVDPSEPDEPPLDLTAEMLRVDFERDAALASDDDTPTLRRLHAQRGVLAQYADRSLAADDLVADFTTEPLDDTGEANTRLARLTATGNATALLPDEEEEQGQDQTLAAPAASATTLTAHQIVATPDAGDAKFGRESGKLLLIADPADPNAPPARITTPTAVLTGPRLLLNEAEQSLQAQGPGRLTQTDGDESLAIVFATSLDYRGDAQPFPTADAVGDVRAQRGTPIQASRVQAHRLALTFFPDAKPSAEEPRDKATDQANTNAAPLPTLQLRTAHATADPDDPATPVELAAQTHPLGHPDDPLTRLTVLGPEVWLTQAPTGDLPPHVQVTGQGQLRLEDYTEPDDAGEPNDANDDEAAADLQLAGQGVTLFRWTDRLYVDLTTNDLTMYGRVGMNHNPLDGQPNILLLADRLRADLTEDPPFTQVLATDPDAEQGDTATEPALRQVQLDGSVIVQQETRRVFADQLLFIADDRDVLLQAYPGGTVRAEDTADDRATFEADAFEWNLDRDRLKITDYRGGLVPIE